MFRLQPISQWTSTNVVEWMAALNFYRYAELFRSKDIKGVDLLSLDKDKLMVSPSSSSSFLFLFVLNIGIIWNNLAPWIFRLDLKSRLWRHRCIRHVHYRLLQWNHILKNQHLSFVFHRDIIYLLISFFPIIPVVEFITLNETKSCSSFHFVFSAID